MIALFVSIGLILTFAAVLLFDLRQMRIPNLLSLILIFLFVALAFSLSPSEIGIRVLQAFSVFVIGFFAFMFRLLGGGDVKILAASALFIPLTEAAVILVTFSGTLIAGTLLVLLLRKVWPTDESAWAFRKTAKMPMGVPIGLAGIASVLGSLVA